MTAPNNDSSNSNKTWESLLDLSTEEAFQRKREWNRAPLTDLFPRIPSTSLERILDICMAKDFTYNLSEPRRWSARHLDGIVVAHVRHTYSDYDRLTREEGVERFAARRRTEAQVWKVLSEWSPWSKENELLRPIFQATLVPREERDPDFDPMDVDDSDYAEEVGGGVAEEDDDPMDLD